MRPLARSNKAVLCRRGVGLLEEFCEQRGIRRIACGKVLVALDDAERAGWTTSSSGHRPTVFRECASSVPTNCASWSPMSWRRRPALTGHVDREFRRGDAGACRRRRPPRREYTSRSRGGRHSAVEHRGRRNCRQRRRFPPRSAFDRMVACGGLQSDRLAELAGDDPDPVIMPFRGEYYALKPERRNLVDGLVYPVPDPRYPSLACIHPAASTARSLIGPTPCSPWLARAIPGRKVSVPMLWKWLAHLRFGASPAATGGPASGRWADR